MMAKVLISITFWSTAIHGENRKRGEKERNGRGGRIRTCDILLPKQARYQAALRPETKRTMGT